jgi:hypothetical protein
LRHLAGSRKSRAVASGVKLPLRVPARGGGDIRRASSPPLLFSAGIAHISRICGNNADVSAERPFQDAAGGAPISAGALHGGAAASVILDPALQTLKIAGRGLEGLDLDIQRILFDFSQSSRLPAARAAIASLRAPSPRLKSNMPSIKAAS